MLFTLEHIILVYVAKKGLGNTLDLKTRITKISVQPIKVSMEIRGLTVYNPKGYGKKALAYVPYILMDFKPQTFYQEGVFLDKIEIHIKEINIVRNKDGQVNLSEIKALTPQEKKPQASPFLADKYVIKVDKVNYIDKTQEESKQLREIPIDVEEEYKGVKKEENISKIIAYKIFFNGKIGNIGVDIQNIQKDLSALAEKNKKLAEEIQRVKEEKSEKVKEAVKQTVSDVKEAVKEKIDQTKEAVKNRTEDAQEIIDKAHQAVKDAAGDVQTAVNNSIKGNVDKGDSPSE